jgi:hypothetical protein
MYFHNKLIWSYKCEYYLLETWLNIKAFETIVASLSEQRLHISGSMPCRSVLSDTTVTVKRCSVVLSPCTNALTHRATAPHNHYQSRTYLPGEPGKLPFFASHRTRSVPPSVVANAGRNLRAHIPSCSRPPLPPLPFPPSSLSLSGDSIELQASSA